MVLKEMKEKVTNHKKKDKVKLGEALKANLLRRKQQKEEQDLEDKNSCDN